MNHGAILKKPGYCTLPGFFISPFVRELFALLFKERKVFSLAQLLPVEEVPKPDTYIISFYFSIILISTW
jgi:hypothetical protein